jgi:hypothetical protein
MRNSIIFVLATFGGIIALGLTVNAIKKARTSSSCWVQGTEGPVEVGCPTPPSPSDSQGQGLTGDKSLSLYSNECPIESGGISRPFQIESRSNPGILDTGYRGAREALELGGSPSYALHWIQANVC